MDNLPDLQEQLAFIMLTVVGLVAITALGLWLARWIFSQKWIIRNANPTMKVVERLPISAKTTLFLLEAEGRQLLIAESSDDVCAVADLSRFRLHPPAAPEPTSLKTPVELATSHKLS
jgi:flagellar biogenesis protein FliO